MTVTSSYKNNAFSFILLLGMTYPVPQKIVLYFLVLFVVDIVVHSVVVFNICFSLQLKDRNKNTVAPN